MKTKKLINYFLQGLFVAGPIAITIYALMAVFNLIDDIIPIRDLTEKIFGVKIYGIGFIIIITLLVILGYFSSNFIFSKLLQMLESMINKSSLIKQIYSSIKDLIGAFAGEQKRFNQPVLVTIDKLNGVQRMGFVTQTDLEELGVPGKVAVYCPISYSFAGDLIIVPKENVSHITGITPAEAMKFIISGGVTKLDD
jgi:uncharacterized membrane protein